MSNAPLYTTGLGWIFCLAAIVFGTWAFMLPALVAWWISFNMTREKQ